MSTFFLDSINNNKRRTNVNVPAKAYMTSIITLIAQKQDNTPKIINLEHLNDFSPKIKRSTLSFNEISLSIDDKVHIIATKTYIQDMNASKIFAKNIPSSKKRKLDIIVDVFINGFGDSTY